MNSLPRVEDLEAAAPHGLSVHACWALCRLFHEAARASTEHTAGLALLAMTFEKLGSKWEGEPLDPQRASEVSEQVLAAVSEYLANPDGVDLDRLAATLLRASSTEVAVHG